MLMIQKRTEWDRLTDGQTEQGVQKFFICTAPPTSLRDNLLAKAARETRFHARGLQRRRKREGGCGRR